jgi:hypothetical protein
MGTNQEAAKYLRCKFSPGMVGNELAVSIHVIGNDFSLFVDEESVRVTDEKKGLGLLRVEIWDSKKGIVALPAETLEQGRRFLRMPIEQLESA